MSCLYLNIGCGDIFVESNPWLNLDYSPLTPSVKKANLLDKLPCSDSSAGVVYSSHFIEHIPYLQVTSFFRECHRVLEQGGMIRLVAPDLENICREYLKCRDQGENEKANFCIIEMLDQCVRRESGGRLGKYWQKLKDNQLESNDMIEYVKYRTGEDVLADIPKNNIMDNNFFLKVKEKILRKFNYARISLLTGLLPPAFRDQNVSYTSVGEKHAWMWDFYTLSDQLRTVGFREIRRVSFDSSGIPDFPLIPLDMNLDGTPRKGHSSMYIEAYK